MLVLKKAYRGSVDSWADEKILTFHFMRFSFTAKSRVHDYSIDNRISSPYRYRVRCSGYVMLDECILHRHFSMGYILFLHVAPRR